MSDESADAAQQYAELVRFMARTLLNNDDFQVDATERRDEILVELRTPDHSRGRVIGRSGRVARAMRTILDTAAIDSPLRPNLDIVD